ncbi:RHS repeat domain-containing protein, partial [Alistipes sp.]|uniref:RHS repeat domain-containing protein n=1 Tax=Alistipes sp. TaxID=1872444 RepID=UPI003AB84A97
TNNRVEPHYFLTDHLGSTRTIVNGDGEVIEQNDYYPFGMRWSDSDSQLSDNRYRYNGKEEQSFVGNPYIDYGARMYDPKFRLGWNASDPLAEKYYPISPYAFCAGNPINNIDWNGQEVIALTYAAQRAILNTLPRDLQKHVVFNPNRTIIRFC